MQRRQAEGGDAGRGQQALQPEQQPGDAQPHEAQVQHGQDRHRQAAPELPLPAQPQGAAGAHEVRRPGQRGQVGHRQRPVQRADREQQAQRPVGAVGLVSGQGRGREEGDHPVPDHHEQRREQPPHADRQPDPGRRRAGAEGEGDPGRQPDRPGAQRAPGRHRMQAGLARPERHPEQKARRQHPARQHQREAGGEQARQRQQQPGVEHQPAAHQAQPGQPGGAARRVGHALPAWHGGHQEAEHEEREHPVQCPQAVHPARRPRPGRARQQAVAGEEFPHPGQEGQHGLRRPGQEHRPVGRGEQDSRPRGGRCFGLRPRRAAGHLELDGFLHDRQMPSSMAAARAGRVRIPPCRIPRK